MEDTFPAIILCLPPTRYTSILTPWCVIHAPLKSYYEQKWVSDYIPILSDSQQFIKLKIYLKLHFKSISCQHCYMKSVSENRIFLTTAVFNQAIFFASSKSTNKSMNVSDNTPRFSQAQVGLDSTIKSLKNPRKTEPPTLHT